MHGHWDGVMGWGWMGFWWILVLFLIGAVLWTAAMAASRSRALGTGGEESPEQILKRRYAKGEIDAESYRRMLDEVRRRD